jgi:hypothetical protein
MSIHKVVRSAAYHRMIDRLNDSLDRREGRLTGMEIRARALMELGVLIQQAKEAANDETEKDATTDG